MAKGEDRVKGDVLGKRRIRGRIGTASGELIRASGLQCLKT